MSEARVDDSIELRATSLSFYRRGFNGIPSTQTGEVGCADEMQRALIQCNPQAALQNQGYD